MDISGEVADLVSIGPRRAGSDSERRAARHLVARLEEMGREAHTEPTRIQPAFGAAHALHAITAVAGSVLAVHIPVVGLAIVLAAAISTFGDLTGAFFLGRLPFGTRASQNVVSDDADSDKPGRLILAAGYDGAPGGMLFGERFRRWPAVFFWAQMVILACATVRLAGAGGTWLTLIQFIPTAALIAMTPLFVDLAVADTREGGNWNASGVATVLRLADRYGGQLEHFSVTVVFTGASQPLPLGMRAWLKRHRYDLDPEATAVVCVKPAGHGTTHYTLREGLVFPSRLHPTLTSICDEIETGTPYTARGASEAYAARTAGIPAIRVASLGSREFAPDSVDPDALARTYDFTAELVERIDEEIGPRLA